MQPRPVTKIQQIEITSRCNLRCVYCTHSKMQRAKIDMTMETFHRALEWVKYYISEGLQNELVLHGLGESTMHPNFTEMIRDARRVLPNKPILFSTNGVSLTEEHVKACKLYGIGVHVSLHRPEKVAPATSLLRKYDVPSLVHANFAIGNAMDWAGQVDWEVTAPRNDLCRWLAEGWALVLSDGRITTCCLDTEGDGIIGHINNEIGKLTTQPYKLCQSCHLCIPKG